MFGKTRHTGWDPNAFIWSIEKGRAVQFERFFFFNLKRCVADLGVDASIMATPRSGDEGRDLEICCPGSLNLWGTVIAPPSDGSANRVFVECKTTSRQKLGDAFLIDATQHRGQNLTAYVLATNGVISPYEHWRAVQAWAQLGAKFILFDRARLLRAWRDAGLLAEAMRQGLAPEKLPAMAELDESRLYAGSQSIRDRTQQGHRLQTYVTIRNYASTPQRISLSLASDISWRSDSFNFQAMLEPGEDVVHLIESEREQLDSDAALRFSLTQEGRAHNLVVMATKPQLVLEPPFMGRGHRTLHIHLRQMIESAHGLRIISLHGEAGVGKSRVVREALQPFEGSRFVFRLTCDPRSGRFNFTHLLEQIAGVAPPTDGPSADHHPSLADAVQYISHLGIASVILMEDLHHAVPEDIAALKALVARPPALNKPMVLIVTGRDDHTFPNVDYFAFLDLISSRNDPYATSHCVEPFSEEDSLNLIRSVAQNLPEVAINRINTLGHNNPFIIIEVMQYLLDVGLARLLSRGTIGVLDPERFKGLDDLPAAVEDLYERRLEALQAHADGESAWLLLCAASFLGPHLPDDLAQIWLSEGKESSMDLLLARRFIIHSAHHDRLEFAHENIYHFLRRWIRRPANSQTTARHLLTSPEFVALLPDLPRGELFSLGARHDEALVLFSPMWTAIQAMTNFSSEEIDRSYFAFLPALFISAKSCARPPGEIAKVACALAYMGVHNFPLLQGEQACATAENMLETVYSSRADGGQFKLAIHQLRSHALQNMGRTGEALRRMLELEASIKENGDTAPIVSYDLYDRLQEYYRKANHGEMMDHYGRLAADVCRRTGDDKIEASHLITMSVTKLFARGRPSLEAADRACSAAERTGIQRFIVFNKLTLLIAKVLIHRNDSKFAGDVFAEARDLLRFAAINTYSDSIIRLQLLLATLAPHVHATAQEGQSVARMYIAAGQESSARFGIGLYDWAFDNLAGAIDHWDRDTPAESARRRFGNCMERLRRRGLTFVGACSGTYPNVHALANVTRFLAAYSENEAADFLRREVTAYDSSLTSRQEHLIRLVGATQKGKPIFWPASSVEMLRLPGEENYFTPIF